MNSGTEGPTSDAIVTIFSIEVYANLPEMNLFTNRTDLIYISDTWSRNDRLEGMAQKLGKVLHIFQ